MIGFLLLLLLLRCTLASFSVSGGQGQHQGLVLLNWFTLARMLFRILHSSKLQYLSLRCFSSATPPHVLKPGDVLRKARLFTEEDVLQYSKVSHDSNPLHTDSATARDVGFVGPLVHGMLVASLFPHIISSNFVSLTLTLSSNFDIPAMEMKWFQQSLLTELD